MKFAKTYEPNLFEPTTYALWEQADAFSPSGQGDPYCVVMPPPNANGNLHIGHGLVVALEDILTRYHRMKGLSTVYIPGADHAGFETWVVYEKALENIGQTRFDFSRDQLYSQVWNFVAEQRGNMELQLRALGASCSWKDLVFTLDQKVIDTVYQTFKRLWDDGLVYRGEKMVSYCTKHQTSFADIEVTHKDEKSTLWDIAYPLVDGPVDVYEEIIVSTTRPETMLGDTAVAVNPNDPRYKKLIGKFVKLPLTNRAIKIIADEYVDMDFGSGAVKITPAHDPNDFEIGERHALDRIQVIGLDGKTTDRAGESYAGLTVEEAREKVLNDLEEQGFRRGEQTIEHSVGHCYKCDTIIEPMVMDQWFINVRPLALRAIEAIKQGKVKFTPESKGKILIKYYENLKDWNISRQIPWGIPIPAFKRVGEAVDNGLDQPDDPEWIFDNRVDQSEIVVNGTTYIRDEDTFDTWFSSGQWPFVVTDHLQDGPLSRFYPNSVMETAADILFPWVSRMIMLGLYATGEVPFKEVYLHGLVLDEHGVKMSKSKGNVINPMEIISLYGSDAFRLGIVASRSAGQNQAFSTSKVIAGRNLCNKLWNIARFIQDIVSEDFSPKKPKPTELVDHWVIRQILASRDQLDQLMSSYRFSEATELIYQTIWNDVADWFIESQKLYKNHDLLAWTLESCLRLVHPFAPFVSETIWQNLSWTKGVLISQHLPEDIPYDSALAADFERLRALIAEARYVASELPKNKKYPILYANDSLIASNADIVKLLSRAPAVSQSDIPSGIRLAHTSCEAWLDVDPDTLTEHRSNLEERLWQAEKEREKLRARLMNENYVKKAPAHLVKETKQTLEQQDALVHRLKTELQAI